MRRGFLIALIIAAIVGGLILGPKLIEYDGYILIVMESGTLQLSVFGFLLSILGLSFASWFTFVLVRYVFRVVSGSTKWLSGMSSRKRKLALTNGLANLFSHDYETARKNFKKIENFDFDGVNLLAAAQVESRLGEEQKARELWNQATEYKASFIAANTALCASYIASREPESALALLEQLPQQYQREPSIVDTWAKALEAAHKWEVLKEKLPGWKKPLGKSYVDWQQKVAKGTFAEIASKEGAIELKRNWDALPRSARKDTGQQAAYIQLLIEQGMHNDAEQLLIELQKKKPDDALLPLFRQLRLANPAATIKKLESWIKQDENNGDLYSILGTVAYYANDYILAEKALSKSINLNKNQHDILLLANIKESQQDEHQALALYKKSLAEN